MWIKILSTSCSFNKESLYEISSFLKEVAVRSCQKNIGQEAIILTDHCSCGAYGILLQLDNQIE